MINPRGIFLGVAAGALILAGCSAEPAESTPVAFSASPASTPLPIPEKQAGYMGARFEIVKTDSQTGQQGKALITITNVMPGTEDSSQFYSPVPAGSELYQFNVVVQQESGRFYVASPDLRGMTVSGRVVDYAMMEHRGLKAGYLVPGETREGLISFIVPEGEVLEAVFFEVGDGKPQAVWAI